MTTAPATKQQQHRVSLSMILSLGIPTSRVKTQLELMGLNFPFNELSTKLTNLSRQQDNAENTVLLDESTLVEVRNVLGDKLVDDETYWTSDEPRSFKFTHAVGSAKYRISMDAVVALTAIVDMLTHELSLHAIKNTIAAGKCTVVNKFLMENIDRVSLYSLFYPLSSYQKMLNQMHSGKEEEPETAAEPEDDSGDVEETDSVLEEETLTGSRKLDQRSRSFLNFVGKIAQNHIYRDSVEGGKFKASLRLSTKFKEFVSDMICEFIGVRLTTILRVLMKLKNAKTVSDDYIMAAVELMLMDAPIETNGASLERLRDFVQSKYQVYTEYNSELKKLRVPVVTTKNEDGTTTVQQVDFDPDQFELEKQKVRDAIAVRFFKKEPTKYEQPRKPTDSLPKPVVATEKLVPQQRNAKTHAKSPKVKDEQVAPTKRSRTSRGKSAVVEEAPAEVSRSSRARGSRKRVSEEPAVEKTQTQTQDAQEVPRAPRKNRSKRAQLQNDLPVDVSASEPEHVDDQSTSKSTQEQATVVEVTETPVVTSSEPVVVEHSETPEETPVKPKSGKRNKSKKVVADNLD